MNNKKKNLFEYIKEIYSLKTKVVLDYTNFEKSYNLKKITDKYSGLYEFRSFSNDLSNDEEYFSIKYIKEKKDVPSVPTELFGLIEESEDTVKLIDDGSTELTEFIQNTFKNYKERYDAVKKYNNLIDENNDIYKYFYDIKKRVDEFDEKIDIIYARGLLLYKNDTSFIRRHVFEANISIEINQNTNVIKLYINRDKNCILEDEFIKGIDNFSIKSRTDLENLNEEVKEKYENSENLNFDKIFNDYLNYISFNYEYSKEYKEYIEKDKFYIIDQNDIIIRNRQPKIWIEDLNKILKIIDEKGDFASENKIVDLILENKNNEEIERLMENSDIRLENILFPLPANEDQERVITQLQNSNLVLVQGPPGTGKSHTIANLISAYVAEGKKILVTSEKSKALDVIKDKIPEEIRNLSMTVLSERANNNELEQSIRKVLEKFEDKDYLGKYERNIEKLKKDLQINYEQKVNNQREIIEVLSRNSKDYKDSVADLINIPLQTYMLGDIAQYLDNNRNLDYITDKNEFDAIAFNVEYIKNLNIIAEEIFDNFYIINDALPQDIELEQYQKSINKITNLEKSRNETNIKINSNSKDKVNSQALDKLEREIEVLILLRNNVESKLLIEKSNYEPFLKNIEKVLSYTKEQQETIMKIETDLYGVEISYEDKDADLIEKSLKDTLVALEDDKISILEKIKYKKAFGVLSSIKYDGRTLSIDSIDKSVTQNILTKIKYNKIINSIFSDCNRYLNLNLDINKDAIEASKKIAELITLLEGVLNYSKYIKDISESIPTICESDLNLQELIKNEEYEKLLEIVDIIDAQSNYNLLNQEYYKSIEILKETTIHSRKIFNDLIIAMEQKNIEPFNIEYERILNYYKLDKLYKKIKSEYEYESTNYKEFTQLFLRKPLEERESIINNFDEILKYYKVKRLFLFEEKSNKGLEQLLQEREFLHNNEKRITIELLETEAWYFQINRMTSVLANALSTWFSLKVKLGKGTGKKANMIRKDMQKQMEIAKDAIPIWIMPIDKVVEQYPISEKPQFDIIIMDESSQSAITSISALLRGKKNVIVGDDKQISPIVVGIEIKTMQELQAKYLRELSLGSFLDNETSIYDLAQSICGSKKVVLKEHFRCLPEIIEFSNRNFYSNEINCLKVRSIDNTIPKPIRLEFVENGTVKKVGASNVNVKEIERILNILKEISMDNNYNGKTIGIIALQNSSPQLNLITDMILQNFSQSFINDRKIKIGNPYDFQGDERDVIILSMIQSKIKDNGENNTVMSMTKKEYERSINVAASRAKEQVILVYSIELRDLNNQDLRYKLLSYYSTYDKEIEKEKEKKFESNFEKDVYKFFKTQNISLTPQYKVGKYRIDFVVENEEGYKIAIECDGDIYHTIEDYEHDINRQNVLERCGWTFIRIRASQFYYDRSNTTKRIMDKINEIFSNGNNHISQKPISTPTSKDIKTDVNSTGEQYTIQNFIKDRKDYDCNIKNISFFEKDNDSGNDN